MTTFGIIALDELCDYGVVSFILKTLLTYNIRQPHGLRCIFLCSDLHCVFKDFKFKSSILY